MFVYTRMNTHMHTCMHIPGVSSRVQSFNKFLYDYAINSVFFSLCIYMYIYSTCANVFSYMRLLTYACAHATACVHVYTIIHQQVYVHEREKEKGKKSHTSEVKIAFIIARKEIM